MGCICNLFSSTSLQKIYPELSYITHKQDIREIYTITQAITFNTVTGLFSANDISPPHKPVYLRFCKLNKKYVKIVAPRFELIYKVQQNFTHLIPYLVFASTEFNFYLIMPEEKDYVSIIDGIRNEKFKVTEYSLRKIFSTIIVTLSRMHSIGIIHGQLNPSKVYVKDQQGYIFDLLMGIESREDLIVEDYHFLAPEILNEESPTLETDVWALGALLYYLITSHTVYPGKLFEEYINNLATLDINFEEPAWNLVSPQLKSLVKFMLERERTCRPTMEAIENSDWVQGRCNILEHTLITDINNFERYHEFRSSRYKAMSVLANTKVRQDVQEWNMILEQNYPEEVSFGVILSYLLGENHPLCEEFLNYWEMPINHKRFLLSIMGLRNLIIQERASILFYQLSKNGQWLEEEDIANLLENTGNSRHLESKKEFRSLIKEHQHNKIRADHHLTFQEFLSFYNALELNPSEEFAMGRFFDTTK
jgi:serine/threonine protein kinase